MRRPFLIGAEPERKKRDLEFVQVVDLAQPFAEKLVGEGVKPALPVNFLDVIGRWWGRGRLVEADVLFGGIFELGKLRAEDQFDRADGTITMLGDDDLCDILLLGLFFVLVGAVDEHDDVCVLL